MNARSWALRGLIVAVLLGVAAWLMHATEWVDIEVPAPPEKTLTHPWQTTETLARRLGATVATPSTLHTLPPANATLVVPSKHWATFHQHHAALRQWVDRGGQLVVFLPALDEPKMRDWWPIRREGHTDADHEDRAPHDGDDDDEADVEDGEHDFDRPPTEDDDTVSTDASDDDTPAESADLPPELKARLGLTSPPKCTAFVEPDAVAPHYAGGRRYSLCNVTITRRLASRTATQWAVDNDHGTLLMRAAQGRGSVTVLTDAALFDNQDMLLGDNALVTVAALQVRPGAVLWLLREDPRPALTTWLWRHADVALLLGAAALLAGLWRGARRFGPHDGRRPPARRSMSEQLTGTAQYLRRHDPAALHAAQIRALQQVARRHIAPFDPLGRPEQARAIARLTGQDAAALDHALNRSVPRTRLTLPATLELLEAARRLLTQGRAPSRSRQP